MTPRKMHEHEVDTSAELVRRLLADQFPEWAGLTLAPVPSAGTDNALYRLGSDMVVRLPRIDWASGQALKEREWLPKLAPALPLAIPTQLALGEPGHGYPWAWSVYRWLEGESAALERMADPGEAARALAHFLMALQEIDTTGGPRSHEHGLRGSPLHWRDAATREALAAMQGLIDVDAAVQVWEAALAAPQWDQPPVWFHGDLLSGNVLVEQGRVSAVIDFSGLGVGDPAPDLMIAWSLFDRASRAVFRAALGVDDATWARGRGQALSQAVIFVPYYRHTNPAGVRAAMRMLGELLAEAGRGE
jgi:aminoglycoside phosphotransferase (APT) family kinase protein